MSARWHAVLYVHVGPAQACSSPCFYVSSLLLNMDELTWGNLYLKAHQHRSAEARPLFSHNAEIQTQ